MQIEYFLMKTADILLNPSLSSILFSISLKKKTNIKI